MPMVVGKKELEQLADDLKCVICMDLLDNPTAAPCSHIFCKDCIQRAINIKAECPLCKTPFFKRALVNLNSLNNAVSTLRNLIEKVENGQTDATIEKDIEFQYRLSPKQNLNQLFPSPEKDANSSSSAQVVTEHDYLAVPDTEVPVESHLNHSISTDSTSTDDLDSPYVPPNFHSSKPSRSSTQSSATSQSNVEFDDGTDFESTENSQIESKIFLDINSDFENKNEPDIESCDIKKLQGLKDKKQHQIEKIDYLLNILSEESPRHVNEIITQTENYECLQHIVKRFMNSNTKNNQNLSKTSLGSSSSAIGITSSSIQRTNKRKRDTNTDKFGSYEQPPAKMQCKNLKSTPKNTGSNAHQTEESPSYSPFSNPEASIRPKQLITKKKITSSRSSQTEKSDIVVMGTNLTLDNRSILNSVVKKLGGKLTNNYNNSVTHLVTQVDQKQIARRTLKYSWGIAKGLWIVSFDWINACERENKWVKEEGYEVDGDNVNIGAPNRSRISHQNGEPGLFDGIMFSFQGKWGSPNPPKKELTSLIKAGDGAIARSNSELKKFSGTKIALVTSDCDSEEAKKLRKSLKCRVVSFSWLMDSISNYAHMEYHSYSPIV